MSTQAKRSISDEPYFPSGSFDLVWTDEVLPMDADLMQMERCDVLKLDTLKRMRWFYLLQISHRELERISSTLYKLLDPFNDVRIISVAGMTGVGKTAFARGIVGALINKMYGPVPDCYLPCIYSKAPANGDVRLPWSTIYRGFLQGGHELLIDRKREVESSGGVMRVSRSQRPSLLALRQALRAMLVHRRVKVLVLDEVLHLLRFEDYAACMDTFKSIGDEADAKFLLLGPYDSAYLISQYAQALSRTALLHFQRYVAKAEDYNDCVEGPRGFKHCVATLQANWPCEEPPNLTAISDKYLLSHCYGGVGLLKKFSLRLLSLQMMAPGEKFTLDMVRDAGFSNLFSTRIAEEVAIGERLIHGSCYGQNSFGTKETMEDLAMLMRRAA